MKKIIITVIVFALILPFVLGACGKKETETENATSAVQQDTLPAETAETDPNVPLPDTASISHTLLARLNKLLSLENGTLSCDPSVSWTDPDGNVYYRCTDPEFPSLGHMQLYISKTMTAEVAAGYFQPIAYPMIDQTLPCLYFYDDTAPEGLYLIQNVNHYDAFTPAGDFQYSDITATGFRATVPISDFYDEDKTMSLQIFLDGDTWKVSEISID